VNQIVPGQEEGNWELLRRHGAGALALTPEAVLAELKRVFAAGGRGWREWRRALHPLSRPAAARDIAASISALAEAKYEPVPLPFRPLPATA
jgi:processive 1,2-diacylglycerol beta-glucosyltransferase